MPPTRASSVRTTRTASTHTFLNSGNRYACSNATWDSHSVDDDGDSLSVSKSVPELGLLNRSLGAIHRRTSSAASLAEKKSRPRKSKRIDQPSAASIDSVIRDEEWRSSSRGRGAGHDSVREYSTVEQESNEQETDRISRITLTEDCADSDSTIRTAADDIEVNSEVKNIEESIDQYKKSGKLRTISNDDHLRIWNGSLEAACVSGWDLDKSVVSSDYLESQKWEHTNWRIDLLWHPDGVPKTYKTTFIVARNSPADFILAAKHWKWFREAKETKRLPRGQTARSKSSVNGWDPDMGQLSPPRQLLDLPNPSPSRHAIHGTALAAATDAAPGGPSTNITGATIPLNSIGIPSYTLLLAGLYILLQILLRVCHGLESIIDRNVLVILTLAVGFDLRPYVYSWLVESSFIGKIRPNG